MYSYIGKDKCIQFNSIHSIIPLKEGSAIEKLKPGKKVVSDHMIYTCKRLNVHISILFTMMLGYGLSPEGMLHGTLVLIPKGRWANFFSSDNFRAITLSSILCKLLVVIVMTKEKDNLCTSNIQFSFNGACTTLWTGMVQETIL